MTEREHPPTEPEQSPAQPRRGAAPDQATEGHETLVGPGEVDPVDHAVDVVRIDEEESSIPGEWL